MKNRTRTFFTIQLVFLLTSSALNAQDVKASDNVSPMPASDNGALFYIALFIVLLVLVGLWFLRMYRRLRENIDDESPDGVQWVSGRLSELEPEQLGKLIRYKNNPSKKLRHKELGGKMGKSLLVVFALIPFGSFADAQSPAAEESLMHSPGMAIMLTLIFIPIAATILLVGIRLNRLIKKMRYRRILKESAALSEALEAEGEINEVLYRQMVARKEALDFKLTNSELAGLAGAADKKGLLGNIAEINSARFLAAKKNAAKKHEIDPALARLVLCYLGTATAWLVVGTSIGEYMGIKFVSPDVDHVSWLSFGRLRPVHTNMVFWGWSSIAMIGFAYYVVPTISNVPIASIKRGYHTLILMNSSVIVGSILLLSGVNNGGGEYREYIWPAMGLFAGGIALTLYNFIQTIANRKTKEIYISNWYVISAIMFLIVIVLVGYLPWWQNGLGETVVQGYYMHQAVGMWFMLFNLGLIYYFLPQQLNTPIYSYSLGILAFWSQILFYTTIGSHHFLFSAIPWWLQTVAIVGSMGMLIPVFSGTTNFLMTIKGNYHKIAHSYTLPFYLVGVVFYFIGSTQGVAEAYRETNLVWHFTDFTVAHSHLTMYGIIAFLLWGFTYTLVPRLTGNEPRQVLVGAHFWLALIGLLFYTIPLMIGGTLRGLSWEAGKPFIDSVVQMAPYWLWRAIGGSLMWCSHLVFAWNLYVMISGSTPADTRNEVLDELENIPVNTSI